MKRLILFLTVILVVEYALYLVLDKYEDVRVTDYYETEISIHRNNFTSSISAYDQIFKTIFNEKINVNEVKSIIKKAQDDPKNRDKYRDWLRMYNQNIYDSLKTVGLSHMQYHFPDGTSFLRMHRPSFFGDGLTEFRNSVTVVNQQHIPVSGFENGRHLLAYRFVFPISYEGEHIGSVELSVGIGQIINNMNRLYGIGYSYLLQKDKIFKDYTGRVMSDFEKLSISNDYFMDTCVACLTDTNHSCDVNIDIRKELINSITVTNRDKIRSFAEFSAIAKLNDSVLFSYMPIKDINEESLGYIISHTNVDNYQEIIATYRLLFIFTSFGAIAIICIFYALDYSRRKTIEMNEVLAARVEEKMRELTEKEQFFTQQSKMATMGEMVALILHQWKQPLNSISMISDILLFECEHQDSQPEMHENLKNIKEQAMFMSQTGNDFRNFLKPSREKTVFNITEAVEQVIQLFEFSFTRYNTGFETEWTTEVKDKALIYGYPNEFKHVMLNLFNNSRDAIVKLREQYVENGEDVSDFEGLITININIKNKEVIVKVADTGGGIPENIIDGIFDKYFSTKEEKGSGIGLYMSRDMVQISMNGKMSVHNVVGGAEFILVFPLAE